MCRKVRHASRGYPIPPGYAAWFLMKPAAIPPVSRPSGRGSWYKNQAHVLIFMILNFICSLNQVFLQSDRQELWFLPVFLPISFFAKIYSVGTALFKHKPNPKFPSFSLKVKDSQPRGGERVSVPTESPQPAGELPNNLTALGLTFDHFFHIICPVGNYLVLRNSWVKESAGIRPVSSCVNPA